MRFLFVDQILSRDQDNYIAGLKHITLDDPLIRGEMVPSLIGETIGQLAAWKVMHAQSFERRPVAGVVSEVKIYRPAWAGESLFLEAFIEALDEVAVQYRGQAWIKDELVFEIVGAIGPMLPMQDFIAHDVVRLQFAQIDRPCVGEPRAFLQGYESLPSLKTDVTNTHFCFDGVLSLAPGHSCRAFKKISSSAPYLSDHFPHKPVLPLTVLLACCSDLAALFLQASDWSTRYQLACMQKIKMSEFVEPGDVVETEICIKQQRPGTLILQLRTYVLDKRVCVVDLVFSEGACNKVE